MTAATFLGYLWPSFLASDNGALCSLFLPLNHTFSLSSRLSVHHRVYRRVACRGLTSLGIDMRMADDGGLVQQLQPVGEASRVPTRSSWQGMLPF
jgi:hypothetical protein